MFNAEKLRRVALAASLALAFSSAVATAADHVVQPVAAAAAQAVQNGVFRYRLGDFEITALSDGTVPQDLHALLKGASEPEIDAALTRSFQRNPVEASINAFLLDTGSRLVLVDTGSGDFFGAGYGGKLVSSLKAAGYEPSQIDDILLTHVHTDHSGGLVHDGHAVFTKAVVHVGKPDVDFFLNPANQNGVDGYDKAYFQQAVVALTPYQASGQLRPFTGAVQILPGITSQPTPGHTPGHSFYRVESKGQSIVFVGDIVHVRAVQLPNPKITITYDVDQPAAAAQRLIQFKSLADSGTLVAGAHLPFPGMGHIQHQGNGYSLVPVDYANRAGF
jgi:glyoxylase-like metal-dependent hydrolase (beta-lactamase superfamily II)